MTELTMSELVANAYALFSAGPFIVQTVTPYCTCSEPLKKWQMILGALMPTIVLGFLAGAVAIEMGVVPMFYMACFLTLGGGGDLLVVAKILLYKSQAKEKLYYDHLIR